MGLLNDKIHDTRIHRFNRTVAESVAVAQMQSAEQHVDNAWKLSAKSFPPDLVYLGYRRCTPLEEMNVLTAKKNQQQTLELARSDVYLVAYQFKYKEEILTKYIYLPYLGKGGLLYLHGKRFTALPVLADETLSVAKGDIFVPFLSAKVTFKRDQYWYRIDDNQTTQYLVYSKIHNSDPSKQARRELRANLTVKCNHTMPHYLFCKFGVVQTFKKYFHADVTIVEGEVDRRIYPEDKYAVCSTSRIKPKSLRIKGDYKPTELKLVIPREQLNNGTLGLVAGFFYVLDHYPDRFNLEALDGSDDEIRLWRIILGHVIFRNNDSEGQLLTNINDHFDSLDQYVDDMTRDGLEAQGYPIDDLYDLMATLIFDFTDILMRTNPASMYGKMLAVLRYVLADVVRAISVFKYKLISVKNKELEASDINKYLSKYLKMDIVFSNLNKHNEIVSIQSAGDNMMFNYTSKLILQEGATGTTRRKQAASFKDTSKLLDPSIAEAGSILALPKSEPTGRTVLNPYVTLDMSYKIRRNKELEPIIAAATKAIRAR